MSFEKTLNSEGMESNVLSLTLRGVVRNDPGSPEGQVPADYTTYQVCEPSDLVFKLIDLENIRTSRVGVVPERGIMSPAYVRLVPGTRLFAKYAYYWYYSLYMRNVFNHMGAGVRANLTPGDLLDFEVPMPPLPEQRRIADFLDDQTTRIDQIITTRREQMDLVERLRRSQMVSLLLGGGSLSGATSDGWYAGLPRRFTVRPLRAHWDVVDCKHRTPEYVAQGFPVVSPGDIEAGRLDLGRCHRFVGEGDFIDLADDPRRCRPGDIVYSRNASAGTAAYVETRDAFTMGQDVCRITSARKSQKYLFYSLNHLVEPQLESARVGSTFTRINIDQIKALLVPVPSDEEQFDLGQRADVLQEEVTAGLTAQQRQVALLQEFKRSLISAAVSGEFDVSAASGRGVPA